MSRSSDSSDDESLDKNYDVIIDELKQKIGLSPHDFSFRKQLISVLREKGDYDELSSQRRELQKMYPLPEDLWIEWLEDEETLYFSNDQLTKEDYNEIMNLYELATSDYLSVKIWCKWCQFVEKNFFLCLKRSINQNNNENNSMSVEDYDLNVTQEDVVAIYDRSLDLISHHVGESIQIWDKYRTFEFKILELTDSSNRDTQIEIIRKLFRRELQTPHIGMEDVYEKVYIPWEESMIGENETFVCPFENQYQSALSSLKERLPFENEIKEIESEMKDKENPDYTKVDVWKKYIEFESSRSRPSIGRIRCLYERALKMFFLVLELWENYISFAMSKLKNKKLVLDIHRRSVRNYPYSQSLWCKMLITLESVPSYHQEIEETFTQALSSGLQSSYDLLQVYRQYIDFHVRKVSDWSNEEEVNRIREIFSNAVQYFDEYFPTLSFEIEKAWANIEQYKIKDLEKVKEIYENAVMKNTKSAMIICEYAKFCYSSGFIDNARSLYKRASGINLDNPELFWKEWLEFERIFGSLNDYILALERCEKGQKEFYMKQEKLLAKSKPEKRKREQKEANKIVESKEQEKPEPITLENENAKDEMNIEEEKNDSNPVYTLYVSNLFRGITDETLNHFFKSHSFNPVSLRIPKDKYTGKPRNFAYVDFESEEICNEIIQKLNGAELGGKSLKIAMSNAPKVAPFKKQKSSEKEHKHVIPETQFVPRSVRSGQKKRLIL